MAGPGAAASGKEKITLPNEKVRQYFIAAHTFEIHFASLFFIPSYLFIVEKFEQ